jgi:2,3-diaminopropionate biosynthesis protein SbnA
MLTRNTSESFSARLQTAGYRLGDTPLRKVSVSLDGQVREICLKLESANPTGSIKDRTGYSLMQTLARQDLLQAETVIVESTSGNLGVALAFLCRIGGYGFIAVVDPKTTQENLAKMEELGARIEMVDQPDPYSGYLLSRLQRVQELCQTFPHYLWTDQYNSQANPDIHYTTTGPEIYHQMDGKVDALLLAVSTGGTLAGIGRYFREVSPDTRVIAVDAVGSVIFGTPPGPRKLTGIGSSRPSSFIDASLYDEHILVRDEEAFAHCRALEQGSGIQVGGSSGAVISACTRYLVAHPQFTNVVCVCPDGGDNYARTIFNDTWLHKHHFDHLEHATQGLRFRAL